MKETLQFRETFLMSQKADILLEKEAESPHTMKTAEEASVPTWVMGNVPISLLNTAQSVLVINTSQPYRNIFGDI